MAYDSVTSFYQEALSLHDNDMFRRNAGKSCHG